MQRQRSKWRQFDPGWATIIAAFIGLFGLLLIYFLSRDQQPTPLSQGTPTSESRAVAPTFTLTDTFVPPTDTPVPPTDTPVPPTDTFVPPTDTSVPPTDTPVPPTDTSVPPMNTPVPPTNTPVPPTNIPIPPTATRITISTSAPILQQLRDCAVFSNKEERSVAAGTFVHGDVRVNGIPQYDEGGGENEGTVVYFEVPGTVYSEFGAGCRMGDRSFLEQIIREEFQGGCDGQLGCRKVRVVIVNSNGQTVTFRP